MALLTGLPPEVAPDIKFTVQLPPNMPWNLDTTCGGGVMVDAQKHTATLAPTNFNANCFLLSGMTNIWLFTPVTSSFFTTGFSRVNASFGLTQYESFFFRLPSRTSVIYYLSDAPGTLFTLPPGVSLPAGLTLDANRGIISGTATAVSARATYTIALQDEFSGISMAVCALTLSVSAPAVAASIPIPAVAAPIGAVILVVLSYYAWRRYDRRKMFHIFISYRVATDARLAEFLCFKLQQHFLSTGHRVRSVINTTPLACHAIAAASGTSRICRTGRTGRSRSLPA